MQLVNGNLDKVMNWSLSRGQGHGQEVTTPLLVTYQPRRDECSW